MRFLQLLLLLSACLAASGCGLLIGNVKPVDEKSEQYRVADLSRDDASWVRLASENESSSDVAYQSKRTASIISLNSSCRPSIETQPPSLKEATAELLLGISEMTQNDTKSYKVQEAPALQTTVRGKLNGDIMMIRTVVVRLGQCMYDLMYFARPEHFAAQEPDFTRFVASLRLQ